MGLRLVTHIVNQMEKNGLEPAECHSSILLFAIWAKGDTLERSYEKDMILMNKPISS